jgi:hypothetical protein
MIDWQPCPVFSRPPILVIRPGEKLRPVERERIRKDGHGTGVPHNLKESAYVRQSQFGNQIAIYTSLGLSKMSTILLVQRLFTRDMRKAWVLCSIFMAVVVAWTITAALMVSGGCSPESVAPRTSSQICATIVARYEFVVVGDAMTDVVLVIIPGYLSWQLQMSILLKLQVLAVFAFRLPLVVLASLFLKTWIQSLSSGNPGVDRAPAIIFQQAELCVSLMAATIPCLKSFIRSFDTGSGVKATISTSNDYGSGNQSGSHSGTRGNSYQMSPMGGNSDVSRKRNRSHMKDDDGTIKVNSRPFASGRSSSGLIHTKSLRGTLEPQGTQEVDRLSQGSSKELFIRRDTHWEITSEEA